MSLLVVGSVAFDGLESPYGKVERTLGGAATYFAVAASFFTPVHLVAIVGEDFTEKDAAVFRGRRIDCEGLERAVGKTFFWAGRYSENLNERVTLTTELNVFADFKPRLPEKYRASKYVFLANIAPDLQRDVLQQVKKRPKIAALDTMNYWIERSNDDLRETLKHVDILMINDAETRQLSSEHNLLRAAKRIFKMGPSTLVVKRGEYGAMLVDSRGVSAGRTARSNRGGGQFRRWIHGLLSRRRGQERCIVAARHGLWVGDGKLHGGEIRLGPVANAEA